MKTITVMAIVAVLVISFGFVGAIQANHPDLNSNVIANHVDGKNGYDVYPTGTYPADADNVQLALDNADAGATVLLKAGTFDFGPLRTDGIGSVTMRTGVNLVGEGDNAGTPQAKIIGGGGAMADFGTFTGHTRIAAPVIDIALIDYTDANPSNAEVRNIWSDLGHGVFVRVRNAGAKVDVSYNKVTRLHSAEDGRAKIRFFILVTGCDHANCPVLNTLDGGAGSGFRNVEVLMSNNDLEGRDLNAASQYSAGGRDNGMGAIFITRRNHDPNNTVKSVEIRNNRMTGYGDGVQLVDCESTDGSHVESNTLSSTNSFRNGERVIHVSRCNGNVINNEITLEADAPFAGKGIRIRLTPTTAISVTDNHIISESGNALPIEVTANSGPVKLEKNVIEGIARTAIEMSAGDNIKIENNTLSLDTTDGHIVGESSTDVSVEQNVFVGEGFSGIYVVSGDDWKIEENDLCSITVDDPELANIILTNTLNTKVEKNVGQLVKQDPFDPSNEIDDSEPC